MEMFYFTLGILSIASLILVGLVVVGMVKVSKLQKELETVKEGMRWEFMGCSRRQDDQDVNFTREIENLHRRVDEKVQETISYTDSRVDKVVNQLREN
jgi:hypothetical protein